MKKALLLFVFLLWGAATYAQDKVQYEFMQMTAIESVVPGGLGRSRLITQNADGTMQEINLENFFSMVGINFGNIRNNDRVITERIEKLANDGWELEFVNTGVYSGGDKGTGIFITRYMFKRPKTKK